MFSSGSHNVVILEMRSLHRNMMDLRCHPLLRRIDSIAEQIGPSFEQLTTLELIGLVMVLQFVPLSLFLGSLAAHSLQFPLDICDGIVSLLLILRRIAWPNLTAIQGDNAQSPAAHVLECPKGRFASSQFLFSRKTAGLQIETTCLFARIEQSNRMYRQGFAQMHAQDNGWTRCLVDAMLGNLLQLSSLLYVGLAGADGNGMSN